MSMNRPEKKLNKIIIILLFYSLTKCADYNGHVKNKNRRESQPIK